MSASPVVQTRKGAVRGVWRSGSAAFLGIPYAQAPIGPLRFAAPVAPEPWRDVRDAVAYGPTPQRGDPGFTLIPEPSIPGDETLTVNVFTPSPGETAANLPVLVYIHGGGFTSGSPASAWYDGAPFARDGIVTVTISYRFGFDGFGQIDDAPTNRGVRDWLMALRWVRDEIAAFGGDPSRVTIAGQSAGAGAVLTLLAMPAARGLFHGVLAISPALADIPLETATAIGHRIAALGGVAPTRDGLASLSEERIVELQSLALRPEPRDRLSAVAALLDGLPWGPVVDGDLVPVPTREGLREGAGDGVPLVIGATDDEFTMVLDRVRRWLRFVPARLALALLKVDARRARAYLAANRPSHRKGTAALLGRFTTDRVFRSTVVTAADARGASPTWVYRFSWVSPVIVWSCHCLDVPFWFDVLDAPGVPEVAGATPPPALAEAMHGAAAAFVRGGDPGWEPWSQHPGRTRVFGAAPSAPDEISDGYASVKPLL